VSASLQTFGWVRVFCVDFCCINIVDLLVISFLFFEELSVE
jgi:hypothetical protein